jgi:sulfite exporter TauE/SafE
MPENLHWLGALCTSATTLQGSLLLGLFAAGAAGSVVHCGPMCGAFVLGQMSERMARLPPERLCEWQRIGNGMLLPYHLGRLTTYAALGAASATALAQFAWFSRLSAVLLTIAALLFFSHAIGRLGKIDRTPRAWGKLIGTVTRRLPRGTLFGEYLLGVTLGFLPCGFLYAAVAAAASSGPAMGAAAMIAFGLGTAPVLMLIGIAGYAGGRRWNRGITAAAPALMILNAGLLLALAWQRLS